MTNKNFYGQAREMFRYAEDSQDREHDPWYFECLDTFLGLASFCQKDASLYPYWTKEFDFNSIIELTLSFDKECTFLQGKRFIEDILSFYIRKREKLWEFTDRFPWRSKNNLISICLGYEEKQLFINANFLYSYTKLKCINDFEDYIEKLSNCSSFHKYIIEKY